jgi:hypothetical protein
VCLFGDSIYFCICVCLCIGVCLLYDIHPVCCGVCIKKGNRNVRCMLLWVGGCVCVFVTFCFVYARVCLSVRYLPFEKKNRVSLSLSVVLLPPAVRLLTCVSFIISGVCHWTLLCSTSQCSGPRTASIWAVMLPIAARWLGGIPLEIRRRIPLPTAAAAATHAAEIRPLSWVR